MKFEFDKKLLKYALYIITTTIIIFISYTFISNISAICSYILKALSSIIELLEPLLIAGVISYLLFPVIRSIEKLLKDNKIFKVKTISLRRNISIFLSYFLVIAVIFILLLGIYFMIGGKISENVTITNIVNDIYQYLTTNLFNRNSINDTLDSLKLPFMTQLKPIILNTITYLQNYITQNIGNFTTFILSIGSGIATFFVSLILSIYILKDYEYFMNLIYKLYKLIFKHSTTGHIITNTLETLHDTFSKFLKGQFLEAFFVGVLSSIALFIVGIDYSFIIGIIAGICNMIPYVGPLVGTVLAAIMALLSGNPLTILYAVIAMLIVQQIDNNFLAPKIVGESVGLHPVFTMMAILIGGKLFGLAGMLLGVPLAASFKILFSRWYVHYSKKHNL